jgi:hypothetical protein
MVRCNDTIGIDRPAWAWRSQYVIPQHGAMYVAGLPQSSQSLVPSIHWHFGPEPDAPREPPPAFRAGDACGAIRAFFVFMAAVGELVRSASTYITQQ